MKVIGTRWLIACVGSLALLYLGAIVIDTLIACVVTSLAAGLLTGFSLTTISPDGAGNNEQAA